MASIMNHVNAAAEWLQLWVHSGYADPFVSDHAYDVVDMTDDLMSSVFNVTQAEPSLAPLYPFAFENDFNLGGHWTIWAREHMEIPVVCCIVYVR